VEKLVNCTCIGVVRHTEQSTRMFNY